MEIILKKLKKIEASLAQEQMNFKEYLTVKEASVYLGISISAMHKITARRELNFYKPGGKIILIKRKDIDLWIEKGKVTTAEDLLRQSTNYLNS